MHLRSAGSAQLNTSGNKQELRVSGYSASGMWLWHFPYQPSITEAMAKFTWTSKVQGSAPPMRVQMFYLFSSLCTKQYVGKNTLVFLTEMCKICILVTYVHEELFC